MIMLHLTYFNSDCVNTFQFNAQTQIDTKLSMDEVVKRFKEKQDIIKNNPRPTIHKSSNMRVLVKIEKDDKQFTSLLLPLDIFLSICLFY